LWHI